MAVEMEINAQLGEFTVRKNRLKALQQSVREMPDFIAALGQTLLASHIEAKATRASKALAEVPVEENSGGENNGFRRTDGANAGRGEEAGAEGIDGGGGDSDNESDDDDGVDGVVVHCAEVKRTEHRLWMRLVGLRHDVQLWDKETRAPALPFNRPYKPLFTSADIAAGLAGAARGVADLAASVGAVGLAESERWISERLDPVVAGPAAGYLDGVELFLPVQTVKGPIAHLAGFAKLPAGVGQPGGPPSDAWGFEPGSNERFPGDPTAKTAKDAAADKKKDKDAAATRRKPPVTHHTPSGRSPRLSSCAIRPWCKCTGWRATVVGGAGRSCSRRAPRGASRTWTPTGIPRWRTRLSATSSRPPASAPRPRPWSSPGT